MEITNEDVLKRVNKMMHQQVRGVFNNLNQASNVAKDAGCEFIRVGLLQDTQDENSKHDYYYAVV